MKLLYSLLLFALFITSCSGQKPNENSVTQTTTSTGQPRIVKSQGTNEYHNMHCGLPDKKGNLWFGTTGEGVYVYDGKTFTNYTAKDGLGNNNVWCIYEDKLNNIWFGTDDGVTRYDGKTLVNFKLRGTSEKNAVWSVLEDKNGLFWFGTTDGIYSYNGKIFTPLLDNKSIKNSAGVRLQYVQAIAEDKNRNLVFGSSMGEGIYSFDGKAITLVKNGFGRIMSATKDKNGDILFGTATGGYHYDGNTFTNLTEKAEHNMWVYAVLEDSKGNLWFSSENGSGPEYKDGGLWRFDGKEYTRFTTADGLPSNAVFCVVEDRDGNYWIGTRKMGLCKYDGKTFIDFSDNTTAK